MIRPGLCPAVWAPESSTGGTVDRRSTAGAGEHQCVFVHGGLWNRCRGQRPVLLHLVLLFRRFHVHCPIRADEADLGFGIGVEKLLRQPEGGSARATGPDAVHVLELLGVQSRLVRVETALFVSYQLLRVAEVAVPVNVTQTIYGPRDSCMTERDVSASTAGREGAGRTLEGGV